MGAGVDVLAGTGPSRKGKCSTDNVVYIEDLLEEKGFKKVKTCNACDTHHPEKRRCGHYSNLNGTEGIAFLIEEKPQSKQTMKIFGYGDKFKKPANDDYKIVFPYECFPCNIFVETHNLEIPVASLEEISLNELERIAKK